MLVISTNVLSDHSVANYWQVCFFLYPQMCYKTISTLVTLQGGRFCYNCPSCPGPVWCGNA